jgi:hypothetical protein
MIYSFQNAITFKIFLSMRSLCLSVEENDIKAKTYLLVPVTLFVPLCEKENRLAESHDVTKEYSAGATGKGSARLEIAIHPSGLLMLSLAACSLLRLRIPIRKRPNWRPQGWNSSIMFAHVAHTGNSA